MCCTNWHLRWVIPCAIFIIICKFFLWRFLLGIYFPEWGPLLNFHPDDDPEPDFGNTTPKILGSTKKVWVSKNFSTTTMGYKSTRRKTTTTQNTSTSPLTTTTITFPLVVKPFPKDPWSNRLHPTHKIRPWHYTHPAQTYSSTRYTTTSPTTTTQRPTTTNQHSTTTTATPRPTTTIFAILHIPEKPRHTHIIHHGHFPHFHINAVHQTTKKSYKSYTTTTMVPYTTITTTTTVSTVPSTTTTTIRPYVPYVYETTTPRDSYGYHWTRHPPHPHPHYWTHHPRVHPPTSEPTTTTTTTTTTSTTTLKPTTTPSTTPPTTTTSPPFIFSPDDYEGQFWLPKTSRPATTTTTTEDEIDFWLDPIERKSTTRGYHPYPYTYTTQYRHSYTTTTTPYPTIETHRNPSEAHHHHHKHHRRREAPIIVTALMDIGRGDWIRFTRPFDIYLSHLMDLLAIQNHIIIYCDKKVSDFLISQTGINGLDLDRIQVVEISFEDLPLYDEREKMQAILENEQANWDKLARDENGNEVWEKAMKDTPEAKYVDYNILVNSKPYLLYKATKISRFPGEFFVWVDAGYSHGSQDKIPRSLWTPKLPHGKITVVQINHETYSQIKTKYENLKDIYRRNNVIISGGFIAGDRHTISQRFYAFYLKVFYDLLENKKMVDDDQTVLLLTYIRYQSDFNVLHGDWFDAFKLLPSH